MDHLFGRPGRCGIWTGGRILPMLTTPNLKVQ